MKCPKCQTENPDTQSFCGDCGAKLDLPQAVPAFTKTLEIPFPQLSKGTTLVDRYEIINELGKGGMGEVYLATDTNLKRQVAIKVLPQQFALDKERLARFEREAQLLASLNHPNCAIVHGLEKHDGRHFLVMELVDGVNLAELLKKRTLPLKESLGIGLQVAEGLEAAHGKGVIHRDLKPANVILTAEGKVKIIDFGLAKAIASGKQSLDSPRSPDITDEMTRAGVIMGTAAFMSPEQACGKSVDHKTDIWAFGCLLYECLTGRRAFSGETATETIAKVMEGEPAWEDLPKETPMQIRFLLRRCFQKNTLQRLQHIGDGRIALEEALEDPIEATTFPSQQKRDQSLWSRALPWVVAPLMGIITIIALWSIKTKEVPKDVLQTRFSVVPPEGEQLNVHTVGSGIALSPDGRSLVYPLGWSLYISPMDSLETSHLALGSVPFFSPDGKWVGFEEAGRLNKISLDGGSPQDICELNISRGGSWGVDDTIIFSDAGILWKVSASGSKRERLIKRLTADQEEGLERHCFPQHLPDGKAILFTILKSADIMSIAVLDLETYEQEILIDKGTGAKYLQSGHLVYSWGNDLLTVEFDIDHLKVKGHSNPVVQDATPPLWSGQSLYAVSCEGTLAYIPSTAEGSTRLVWVDRSGKVERLPLPSSHYGSPRISPNGKQLLFTRQDERNKIWIYDLDRGNLRPLMDERGEEWLPVWTPDSRKVAFASTRFDGLNGTMFWKSVDSDEPAEVLVDTGYWPCPHSFSPNGKLLAFRSIGDKTGYDIWLLPMEGDRKPELFLQSRAYETWPRFSPDGKWILYQALELDQMEVYVRPSQPGAGRSWQISNSGGEYPLWAPNGKEIFYATAGKTMSVSFRGEPEVYVGKPKEMFTWFNLVGSDFLYGFDIHPDGQRFVMLEVDKPRTITVVLNRLEELKDKVKK